MVKARSKCGIYGIWSNEKNLEMIPSTLRGLQRMQHRGRESCGISYIDNTGSIKTDKTYGLVKDLHSRITGTTEVAVIGHVRYSTSGSKTGMGVVQPLQGYNFALAHNGNIPNLKTLKNKLAKEISVMSFCKSLEGLNDTGTLKKILELMGIEPGIEFILKHIQGAYSLIILTQDAMYLVRDPMGFKPLCFACIGETWYASSESIALPKANKTNVAPGSAYRIDRHGVHQILDLPAERKSICSFEFVYFMYYKTFSDTLYVDDVRHELGYSMVEDDLNIYPDNTIVIGSPNSGISYAKAYSKRSGIPYLRNALKKERKERTFILPSNGERISKIKKIMIVDKDLVSGNEVILIDDSIVRGNTIRHVIKLLRDNGAIKVHVKVAFPKIISPCYYGIDFPTYEELIGHKNTDTDICEIIGADSLQFTTVPALQRALKNDIGDTCVSCLTDIHDVSNYDW